MDMSAFKAYDIRGKMPDQLNEEMAYRIGIAFGEIIQPKRVAVGFDIRLSSPSLSRALMQGIAESGTEVLNLGLVGTEEVYYATDHLKLDGGVMVTASHNPKDYNGMKLVRENAKPISSDSGLNDIREHVERSFNDSPISLYSSHSNRKSSIEKYDISAEYTQHILSYLDMTELKSLKIVVNAGNGVAGDMLDGLESSLPFELIKIHHQADGNFPNGIPNPLLPENRDATSKAVIEHQADFGVAWDGDADRCFLFDEKGEFIEGYYIVGMLAKAFVNKNKSNKIIHDPRCKWNTIEIVEQLGGTVIESKSGHSFIKERMRLENAAYGGEMSAHHYFRDFAYCDSGMLPWLLVAELVCVEDKSLSAFVSEAQSKYPVSGEINRKVKDVAAVLERVTKMFGDSAVKIEHLDGLSMEFESWRFNLRSSNTEPVMRLNVEARGDETLLNKKTTLLLELIE